MSRVKNRDTAPEWLVRRIVFGLGYRYRLHARGLPGTPDLVFPGKRKVIFVHGCFWHQHDCGTYRMPRTRQKFWQAKLSANRRRDAESIRNLRKDGWKVLVVWECDLKGEKKIVRRVKHFLGVAR